MKSNLTTVTVGVGFVALALIIGVWRSAGPERAERQRLYDKAHHCAASGGVPLQGVLLRVVCVRSWPETAEVMP